jgi:DNA-binding GntR family transcriptional regulator
LIRFVEKGNVTSVEIADTSRKNLAEHVYEAVRAAIASGELAPRSLYSVNTIAQRLSVSRTPVREALLKLEDQGMVQFERNKGARILATSAPDLLELFSLRILLETASAYRAAQNATPGDLARLRKLLKSADDAYRKYSAGARTHLEPDAAFHKEIAVISGSRKMADIIDGVFDQQMLAELTSADVPSRAGEIVDDHHRIFGAISEGNAKEAANAMRNHLIGSCRALVFKEMPDGARTDSAEPPYIDLLLMWDKGIIGNSASAPVKGSDRKKTVKSTGSCL